MLNEWIASLSISIERDGRITLGSLLWGGRDRMLKIWQLEHTSAGAFAWCYIYDAGLIHKDAETLQQLLLVLEEKAKIHFQST